MKANNIWRKQGFRFGILTGIALYALPLHTEILAGSVVAYKRIFKKVFVLCSKPLADLPGTHAWHEKRRLD